MTQSPRTVRTTIFGLALAVAAAGGLAACGSNTKSQQPAAPANNVQGPAPTSPPATSAPAGGGASF